MTHKFVVGQTVDFNKRYPWMSGGLYEVVSTLPDEDNSPTYRVKNQAEPFARVAKETDLIAAGSPPAGQQVPVRWADLLSQPSGQSRSR